MNQINCKSTKYKLNNDIEKYTGHSYYLTFKYKLNQLYKQIELSSPQSQLLPPSHYQAIINSLNDINELINEPKSLLSTNLNHKVSIFDNPNPNHELFAPLHYRIDKSIEFIKKLTLYNSFNTNIKNYSDNNSNNNDNDNKTQVQQQYDQIYQLIKLFEDLINGYRNSINYYVDEARKRKERTDRMDLYDNPVYLTSEDLKFKDLELEKAYQMSCYNKEEYCFVRFNKEGNSIGRRLGNEYFKVDNEGGLLNCSKENAVYSFYNILFGNDQKLLNSSQLLLLSKVPLLPTNSTDSLGRKIMNEIRETKHFESNTQVFIYNPQLRYEVEKDMEFKRVFPIQVSHFIDGLRLKEFLETNKSLNQLDKTINNYSFSCHIIASLLLLQSDYKQENIIIDSLTNYLVGIDNDHALEGDELLFLKINQNNMWRLKVKNILYLLEPLMNKPVDEKAKLQFISKQPHHIVLEWLSQLLEKEYLYNQLIEMSLFTNELQQPILASVENVRKQLNLPLKFQPDWINSLLNRIIKIRSYLIKNPSCTHQDLFNEIHPFASVYYKIIKELYKDGPLQQIMAVYNSHEEQVLDYLNKNKDKYSSFLNNLSNTKFIQLSTHPISISIQESIINYLQNLNVEDLFNRANMVEESFVEFIKLVVKLNGSVKFKLNHDWISNIQKLLVILMKHDSNEHLILDFLKILQINSSKLIDQNKLGERKSIIHIILSLSITVSSKIKYIKLFNSLGSDIDIVENNSSYVSSLSPLDVVISSKEQDQKDCLELFKLIIELGGGKTCIDHIVVGFYCSLSIVIKKELIGTIDLLTNTNPYVGWLLSINHLFPIIEKTTSLYPESRIIYTSTLGERCISNKQWVDTHDIENNPIKMNKYGKRCVTFVEDCGHRIYLKFNPQCPGVELAVSLLGRQLFGSICSPYSEVAVLNGIPVLLVQEVKGETLNDFIKDTPSKLRLLDSFSLSKLIILEILINNADGNLANFIIKKVKINNNNINYNNNSIKYKYVIYSIDNDLSFMPAYYQEIRTNLFLKKLSLQVETSLLLLDQMNEDIHQDVVQLLLNKDPVMELRNLINSLSYYHQKWETLFSNPNIKRMISNRKQDEDSSSIIGVSIIPGQIKTLYSKITRLQEYIKKSITHLNLLEALEPVIAKRYKKIINVQSPYQYSLLIRYQILKNTKEENLLTSSIYLSGHVLESKDIPNADKIKSNIKNGRYCPEHLLDELLDIESIHNNIIEITKAIKQSPSTINQQAYQNIIKQISSTISPAKLEMLLKESKLDDYDYEQEKQLLSLLDGKELLRIYIRNSKALSQSILNNFNFSNITVLDFSGSKKLKSISNGLITKNPIIMPYLVKLNVNDCEKLYQLKIIANSLLKLSAINCRFTSFSLVSPDIDTIYLSNGSILTMEVLHSLKSFNNLKLIDISNNNFLNGLNINNYIKSIKIIFDNSSSNNNNSFKSLPLNINQRNISISSYSNISGSISFSSGISYSSPESYSNSFFSNYDFKSTFNIISFGTYSKNANLIGRILSNKEFIDNYKPICTNESNIRIDDQLLKYFFLHEQQLNTQEFILFKANAIVMFFDPSLNEDDTDNLSSLVLLKRYYKYSIEVYGQSIPYILFGAFKNHNNNNNNNDIPNSIKEFINDNLNIKLIYSTSPVDSKEKELSLRIQLYNHLSQYFLK